METSNYVLPYLLNYKHSLKTHILYYETLEKITNIIKKLPHYHLLVNDAELLLLVCRLVEIMVVQNKRNSKLNKKELVVDIYRSVFDVKDDIFYNKLRSDIEFLHSHKKIRGINQFKMGFYYIKSVFKKCL